MNVARIAARVSLVLASSLDLALALDPHTRISQYSHTAWRVQDGVFEAAPNAVTQTADGYIWIGTGAGLLKYDGARFETWTPPQGKSLPDPNIISLLGASDGTLWIGTARGLVSWKNNDLREHLTYRINGIIEDRSHRIWVARARTPEPGGLCEITPDRSVCFGGDKRINFPTAVTLTNDRQDNIWAGGTDQLLRWHDGSFESYFGQQLSHRIGPNGVESVAAAPDGSIWVSVPSERSLGLMRIESGHPARVVLEGAKKQEFTNLFFDRQGALWLSTADDGLYRFFNGRVDHFRSEDGLSSNTVVGFFEDREGNLWVTTSKGLDFFRDNRVVSFSTSEGLSADQAASVLATDDGTVWVGNRRSLEAIRDGKVISYPIPGERVAALWQDRAKRLWVGVDDKLLIYEHGQFHQVKKPDGTPLGMITAIMEDRDRNIWAVANPNRRVYRLRDLQVQEELSWTRGPRIVTPDPAGGVWIGLVDSLDHYRDGKLETVGQYNANDLVTDADGSLWIATRDGLVHWKGGRTQTLAVKNGLKCDTIYSVIRDERHSWLIARCGLIEIANSELERWLRDPNAIVQTRTYDALDGARPSPSPFHPASTRSPDGRIWFTTDALIQVFDPNLAGPQSSTAPVYITGIRGDRNEFAVNRPVRIPPNPRDLEIRYTALSYSIPQRVRFRYKLEPRDRDWQEAGTRRQAFYSDLGPGSYRFRVIASNSDGVWNETGDVLEFAIRPAYYQTIWFRGSSAAACLLALWALFRIRLNGLRREFNARLEGQVDERLRVARELHDTLLQSFQGLIPVFQTARNLLPGRTDRAAEVLDEGLKDAANAIAEGRNAIQNLRANPAMDRDLDELLTAAGIELAASPEAKAAAPAMRVVVEGSRQPLVPLVQDEVYRIAREMLRNAFRHANASHIETEIRYDENMLRLRVRDDGKGIDMKALKEAGAGPHWGLPGMHERAERIGGSFKIWSESGAGTEAELTVPGRVAFAKFSNSGRWSKLIRRLGLAAQNREA